MTDDEKISQRYRELGREEPPRALDDAILAASRRAADIRPAPLVVPSGRRRWYFPLAAAAIIVLAVAVTVHVERERPDSEVVAQTEPLPSFVPDPRTAPVPEPHAGTVTRESAREEAARADAAGARARAELPAKASPQAAPKPAPAPQAMRRALEAPRGEAALSSLAKTSPEQWLLAIDDLKRQGRHEEAEKQLAEFRKRYPNYRIPEAITEKFEKR